MKYRPEIDGLRAVAVLLVLIFHINPSYLPGGFIGVDVFFVISGFLITSILKKSINENTFEYKSFYTRRIKRLLPLFYAVVVFCLIAGYFVFFPSEYRQLGGDVLAANVFLANVKSSISVNYFAADLIKPTLHFWSLAVEEQFYFIMPTFFLIIHKYCRKFTVHIFAALIIISLGLSEIMSSNSRFAQFSYFLLPTRAWELLAGCLLAVVRIDLSKLQATLMSTVGLLMIIFGALITDEFSVFPGMIALFPVVGSMLVIIGGDNGAGRLLKAKPLVFIGLASYSIYMWHWPIIIFIKSFYNITTFTTSSAILLGLGIILIGYLSQKYIEDFFRFRKSINFRKAFLYYFLVPCLITGSFAAYAYINDGMPSRFGIDEKFTTTTTVSCSAFDPGCFITKEKIDTEKLVMIGDSHANHFSNLFAKWFDDHGISLQLFASGGCNFYSTSFYSNACENVKTKIASEIRDTETILIAKRFDLVYMDDVFLNEFYDYVTSLTKEGKDVVLIRQVPKFKSSGFLEEWMQSMRYGGDFNSGAYDIDNVFLSANETVLGMFKENRNVKILDFNPALLENGKFLKFDENHLPIFYNNNHLTAHGAEWIYDKIKGDESYDWLIDLGAK